MEIVTESAKAAQNTSFYHIYLFFCVGYTIPVSFIEFLRKFWMYDEIFDKILLGKVKFERLKIRSSFKCR